MAREPAGDSGTLADADQPTDETKHLYTLGDDAGEVPLAAVFRTRKGGRKRRRREPTRSPDPRREPEPSPGESYDVVLTEDYQVQRTRRTGPLDAVDTDEFERKKSLPRPERAGFGSGVVELEPTRPMESPAAAEAAIAKAEAAKAKSDREAALSEAEAALSEAEAAKAEAAAVKAEAQAAKAEARAAKAELETVKAEAEAAKQAAIAATTSDPPAEPEGSVESAPSALSEVIPADADPVWAAQAVLGLAEEYARANRTASDGAWFSEVFRNEFLLASPPRETRTSEREAEFIEEQLGVAAGGRLFDLCCGYGRHTLPLARKGYETVGLDLSLDMLKHALTKAQKESLSIKFVHGDMRDLNFDEVFDGAYSMDTSFGFFSDAENLGVLRGVLAALKKGGRFVLDVANRDHAIRDVPNRNWWEGDGCLVQEDIEFSQLESRLRIKRFLVFADGLQREYDISLRLYSLHELQRMLSMVGFEVVDVAGSTHTAGAYFGAESPRIIVTCQKP